MGPRCAEKIINDGRIDSFVAKRYESYESGIGKKIKDGTATLEELEKYAFSLGDVTTNTSGRQEYLESIVNSLLF